MLNLNTTTGDKNVSNNINVAGVAMSLNKNILPKRYYWYKSYSNLSEWDCLLFTHNQSE